MKRILLAALAAIFVCCGADAAVTTIQVTIGAGTTQLSTVPVACTWVVFQDNTADAMRIGDANTTSTRGITLTSPNGSFYVGPLPYGGFTNLKNWYVAGTSGDVIDVVCDEQAF